jgi:hypothetical protein
MFEQTPSLLFSRTKFPKIIVYCSDVNITQLYLNGIIEKWPRQVHNFDSYLIMHEFPISEIRY